MGELDMKRKRLSKSLAGILLPFSVHQRPEHTNRPGARNNHQSEECRANSTGISGPSSNQYRRIGSVRGSQIKAPQPRHAMFAMGLHQTIVLCRHSKRLVEHSRLEIDGNTVIVVDEGGNALLPTKLSRTSGAIPVRGICASSEG